MNTEYNNLQTCYIGTLLENVTIQKITIFSIDEEGLFICLIIVVKLSIFDIF